VRNVSLNSLQVVNFKCNLTSSPFFPSFGSKYLVPANLHNLFNPSSFPNRDFQVLSTWLCDRFIRNVVGASVGDPDYEDGTITEAGYLEIIGLDSSLYLLKDSD